MAKLMYFGENRHPLSRKPDSEKQQLAEQNALLKKLLQQQIEGNNNHRSRRLLSFISPHRRSTTSTSATAHRTVIAGCVLLILTLLIGGVIFYVTNTSKALPANIIKNAGFTLYYPSPMPEGFAYKKGSAKMEGSSIFYTLQSSTGPVVVSEQFAPANSPDLTHLGGFTSLSTVAGKAAIGSDNTKQPIAIIISNTTMVILTGRSRMPSDTIATLAQAMRSISQ